MPLGIILDEIGKLLPKTVTYEVGDEHLAEHQHYPRVVANPTTETIEPNRGSGGDGIKFPRRFLSRASTVDFHVWEAGIEECEALAEQVWQAIQILVPGSFRPGTAEWIGGAITDHGVAYKFTAIFLIPISRAETVRRLSGGLPITPELDIPTP